MSRPLAVGLLKQRFGALAGSAAGLPCLPAARSKTSNLAFCCVRRPLSARGKFCASQPSPAQPADERHRTTHPLDCISSPPATLAIHLSYHLDATLALLHFFPLLLCLVLVCGSSKLRTVRRGVLLARVPLPLFRPEKRKGVRRAPRVLPCTIIDPLRVLPLPVPGVGWRIVIFSLGCIYTYIVPASIPF